MDLIEYFNTLDAALAVDLDLIADTELPLLAYIDTIQ